MAELTEHAARDLGVRIISPDRPGISGSAFQAGRKLVDWPPIVDLSEQSGLLKLYRLLLALYRSHPRLLRALFYLARPVACLRPPIRFRPLLLKFLLQPCDAAALCDAAAFEACFESQRRAWRGSAKGVMSDAEIYAQPWGFRLEDVEVPVRLWHGKEDRAFSFRVAQET
ncbi:MAG: hypothetical protein DMF25_07160, partial [Verrucomicrobia bacterium]